MSELCKGILGSVTRSLAAEKLDAIVAMSPDNAPYVAAFLVPSQKIIRHRLVMCVVTAGGDSCHIVPDMEESYTRAYTGLARVRPYNEFTETPMTALADTLREMGVVGGKVGIEMDFIPAANHLELTGLLPGTTFVDAVPFFAKVRAIKTPAEQDILRRLGRVVEGAHRAVGERARAGMTEMDVALILYESLLRGGADDILQIVVGSGERSAHANPYATERPLGQGDVVRVDIYAKLRNYLSDCARTYVVGPATVAQIDLWRKMLEARQACLDMIKPGAHTAEIYRVYSSKMSGWGLKTINFVGHGLGVTLHEDPYVGRYGDWVLQEGMVLCIEPYLVLGDNGFQVEDEVLVTATGCELLTGASGPPALVSIR
jgi:Xaa-Pro dipeptidase